MNNKELFTQILGIATPWEITKIEFKESTNDFDGLMSIYNVGDLHVYIDFKKRTKFKCSECDKLCPVYDSCWREFRHLDIFQNKCIIHARIPRIDCKEHGIKTITPDWTRGNHFTYMFEAFTLQLVKFASVSRVAKILRVSDTYIWSIVNHYVCESLKLKSYENVKIIGCDEKSIKGHHYLTAFLNLENNEVIGLYEGKDNKTVSQFVQEFMSKNGKVNKIEVITCDMSLAFEKGFKDNFPLAQCVIDKFHIIKHANEATDAVRKNLVKTLAKTGDEDVLTHAKYAALKNVENLTEKQQAKYETIMTDKRCNDLARAICLREKLQLIMNNIYLTREEAYARLKKLITKLKRTRLEPLIKFANLLVNHLDEICNYFKYRYTNAKLEGMNNRIEAIKRRARGFRKIEYFKNMIWIEGGHLDFASIFKKNL